MSDPIRLPFGRGTFVLAPHQAGHGVWLAHVEDSGLFCRSTPVTERDMEALARTILAWIGARQEADLLREEEYD